MSATISAVVLPTVADTPADAWLEVPRTSKEATRYQYVPFERPVSEYMLVEVPNVPTSS
jgi:hypothetical protein